MFFTSRIENKSAIKASSHSLRIKKTKFIININKMAGEFAHIKNNLK